MQRFEQKKVGVGERDSVIRVAWKDLAGDEEIAFGMVVDQLREGCVVDGADAGGDGFGGVEPPRAQAVLKCR